MDCIETTPPILFVKILFQHYTLPWKPSIPLKSPFVILLHVFKVHKPFTDFQPERLQKCSALAK